MDDPGSIIAALAASVTTATAKIPTGSIILYLLLIVFSAYFSGTEISFASVNRIHLMSSASKGSKGAERALYILDNFDEALSVMLIGNNIVNIGCATLSTFIATHVWGIKACLPPPHSQRLLSSFSVKCYPKVSRVPATNSLPKRYRVHWYFL